ncbi:MAG TPA: serine hydrolase domain-containing protein, partial [Vicinamibacterales bacterium]
MRKIRLQTWLLLLVLGVGGIITAILGLFAFVMITAETWHPDPQKVPSDTQSAPPAQWADAVQQARQTVRAKVAEQNLPGLSVAVGIGGDIVWAEGFGWADLDARLPPTPRMKFRIGTASKVLTSAAVGLLLEEGRLKLDDEIQTYVPAYPKKPWPVTLRQLMGHLAGVTTDAGDEGPYDEPCKRPVEAL